MFGTFLHFLAQGTAALCIAALLFTSADPVPIAGGLGASLAILASKWALRDGIRQVTYWVVVAAAVPLGTLFGLLLAWVRLWFMS